VNHYFFLENGRLFDFFTAIGHKWQQIPYEATFKLQLDFKL